MLERIISDIKTKIYSKVGNSPIYSRILSGALWTLLGTFVAKVFVLLAGIITSRILGIDDYGQLGIIRTTLNMFVIFAMVGLGITTSKFVAEYRTDQKLQAAKIIRVTNLFGVSSGIIVTFLVFYFSKWISLYSFNTSELSVPLQIGSFVLFFGALNGVQVGCLSGFENFKSIALNTLIAGICELVLVPIGAFYFNVEGGIAGLSLSYFILWGLNFLSIKRTLVKFNIKKYRKRLSIDDFGVIWKFSLPAALSSFLVMPVFWYVKSLLVKKSGFAESAMFDVADQWKAIVLFIPGALSNITLPVLSSLNKDPKGYFKAFKVNILLNFFISLMITSVVILFSSLIFDLYGDEFTNKYILIWLSLSAVFTALSQVVGKVIASKNKLWLGLIFNFIWATLLIILSNLLIPRYNAEGLAIAVLLSYFVHVIIQTIYVKRYFRTQG